MSDPVLILGSGFRGAQCGEMVAERGEQTFLCAALKGHPHPHLAEVPLPGEVDWTADGAVVVYFSGDAFRSDADPSR